jgi:hypothetical protein
MLFCRALFLVMPMRFLPKITKLPIFDEKWVIYQFIAKPERYLLVSYMVAISISLTRDRGSV